MTHDITPSNVTGTYETCFAVLSEAGPKCGWPSSESRVIDPRKIISHLVGLCHIVPLSS